MRRGVVALGVSGIGATAATEFFGVAGFREWCPCLGWRRSDSISSFHGELLQELQANSSVHLPVEFQGGGLFKGFA